MSNLTTSDCDLSLNNVSHASQLNTNLVYVHPFFVDNDIFIELYSDFFCLKEKFSRRLLHKGPLDRGFYKLLTATIFHSSQASAST